MRRPTFSPLCMYRVYDRVWQALLNKYESFKTAGKSNNGAQQRKQQQQSHQSISVSDEKLFKELGQELLKILAGDKHSNSTSTSATPAPPITSGSGISNMSVVTRTADADTRRDLSRGSAAASRTGAREPERKISILVVDDSHISCKLAIRALGNHNFNCSVRERGVARSLT